jgi:hypothetical protein
MMFKSVDREKRFDIAFIRVCACLFACRDPKSAISFCNNGNLVKHKTELLSTDLMNRLKMTMTASSLLTSKHFKAARASVSPFSFKKPITWIRCVII